MKFTDARADVVCTAAISAFAAKVNVCKLGGAELSLATLRRKNTGPNTDPFFLFFLLTYDCFATDIFSFDPTVASRYLRALCVFQREN